MNPKMIVGYDDLYSFALGSSSIDEFVSRMQVSSAVIVFELAKRIGDLDLGLGTALYYPLRYVKLIDQMNEEIVCLVENINSTDIVDGQRKIKNNLLIRLIEMNHPKLHEHYMLSKKAILN